ncbi:ABC transporter permease [Clostridium sp.]|uniref:ABC transporter permease n=1 Tax=Clostridium sp. TaxID=1506 RepID=UPI001DF9C2B8|nr:ABC transporter permease [Clostridium sp.]MBS5937823.1 ABC transporter permease [Clostridium sp.]
MRLLGLELKRVLKTRLTWILLLGAVICSVLFAYIPTTFMYYTDNNGQTLEGISAIRRYKEIREEISGEVTPEKIQYAIESVQETLRENGVKDIYELPSDVYKEKYLPYAPLIKSVLEVNVNPVTGMEPEIMDLNPGNAKDFYEDSLEKLISLMEMEQPNSDMAQKDAIEKFSNVPKPFYYYSGITADAMDYQPLLLFIIMLCCSIIAAPIFSSDYQTEADSILRCTKYGRNRLAVTKILSAFLISGVAFTICALIWILVTNSLFGWESLQTSIQMLFSINILVPWTVGQMQWILIIVSGILLSAMLSFVLFLSSICKTQVASLTGTLVTCILPIFLPAILPGSIGSWVHSIWPSGGLALQNSILYDFAGFDYLNIGSFSIWVPYAVIIVAIIQIPLFLSLTVYSYNHHKLD